MVNVGAACLRSPRRNRPTLALIRLADRIETLAGHGDAPDHAFCSPLASDEPATYANFTAKDSEAMWPKLRAACSDTLRALANPALLQP
jgi:hypothetical protein